MANTEFYNKAYTDTDKITWKDIFSEFRLKHTKQDMEYALLAGTSLDTATEATMLLKWRKPWLFYRLFWGGMALIAVIDLVVYACIKIFGILTIGALNLIFVMVPPLIFPLVLMVFFWELNIPRDISIYQMLGYFFVGGMLSIFATLLVEKNAYALVGSAMNEPYTAPLTEEPGKLAAVLVFLALIAKRGKHKIFGLTGLTIGAAVGAGFGGFESAQYAYNVVDWPAVGGFYIWMDAFWAIWQVELIRGLLSLGGHILFCAPYAAAVALHMKEGKLDKECFLNKDFAVTFGCSFVMHFIWNYNLGIGLIKYIFVISVLWISTLYITRKCFRQTVEEGKRHEESAGIKSKTMVVQCIQGPLKGAVWQSEKESLIIGRSIVCGLRIPGSAPGISRQHCSVQPSVSGWTLRDLNSSYGTYIGDEKLAPGIDCTLHKGDVFYLGGKKYAFKVDIQ